MSQKATLRTEQLSPVPSCQHKVKTNVNVVSRMIQVSREPVQVLASGWLWILQGLGSAG